MKSTNKRMSVSTSFKVTLWLIAGFGFTSLAHANSIPEASQPGYANYELAGQEIRDPFEPVNRYIYEFNQGVDFLILNPAADIYKTITPPWKRDRINDLLSFLREPVTLVNNILQGDFTSAGHTFGRIFSNAILGLGVTDIAGGFGVKKRPQGLDDTLAYYCMESGPYIVLPILGPSSARDVFGMAGDLLAKPTTYFNRSVVVAEDATRLLSKRSDLDDELEDLQQVSLDSYALVRSIYSQNTPKVNKANCR